VPICVLREQLTDYDAWRTGFYADLNANAARMQSLGVSLEAVYRDADDPNVILTTIRAASREPRAGRGDARRPGFASGHGSERGRPRHAPRRVV